MGYMITPPMIITPGRKLPGVRIGGEIEGGMRIGGLVLSVEEVPDMFDGARNRPYLRCRADREWTSAVESETGEVVLPGYWGANEAHVPGGGTVSSRARERIAAVLSFLLDDARHHDKGTVPEDGWTFGPEHGPAMAAWASHYSSDIEAVQCELEAV